MEEKMNFENINRQELLKTYAKLVNQRDELLWNNIDEEPVDFPQDTDFIPEVINETNPIEAIGEEIFRLRNLYLENLPKVSISRCPFTGEVLQYSIDNQGLDGLWWNFYDPVRDNFPELNTFVTLSGALKVNQPLEYTEFPVMPGPEIPYVLPALLENEEVLAVLSSIKVGNHTAYTVVYYSKNPSSIILRPNEWGIDRYYYQDENGELVWSQEDEIIEIKDFDLIPWIEAGKLFWILPEDKTLNLRADIQQCPYVGLSGNQNIQILQDGELIELETDEEFDSEVEETLSTLEVEEDEDLTPVPEELWKLLPQEGGNDE